MRGDVSIPENVQHNRRELAPHAWRCFHLWKSITQCLQVSSTCVEMFPASLPSPDFSFCQLHMRGDVSMTGPSIPIATVLAPHAWRCFYGCVLQTISEKVSSTCVEMFLQVLRSIYKRNCQLHMRGDVSYLKKLPDNAPMLAPHAWRCFYLYIAYFLHIYVSSTCVEMFPQRKVYKGLAVSQLHMRGDVSLGSCFTLKGMELAPHAWRCFSERFKINARLMVSSTCVEMFLCDSQKGRYRHCQLHMRGDVSRYVYLKQREAVLAPHAWRCFLVWCLSLPVPVVSSTCVEMFPKITVSISVESSQLHMRGDVSGLSCFAYGFTLLAPHAWRCFRKRLHLKAL